ncbi:MAG: dihydroorotate dehydrogenase (quinone), partial [Verrucomicrobiota bacterium]|nr:dihydroorotate dehydrogenase (quinone) [Verrucomicrobiota bacterium]
IIGVGGINSKKDAEEKLSAGAALIQVYTGLIYQGPSLIRQLISIGD